MTHRPPFDIKRALVAATSFTFAGDPYVKGDPFPRSAPANSFNAALIRRQYEARKVDHVEEAVEEEASPVQMRPAGKKHSYVVTAPWLDEPETIRGQANAEKRVAELRDAGPPLGWIEGGSEVTIEGGDGGWYTVKAPWLATPERVQGREAAEKRQAELHEAGEPETWGGVTLREGENGYWTVTAAWDPDNAATAHGREAAREVATAWRSEGAPETLESGEGGEGGLQAGSEGGDAGEAGGENPAKSESEEAGGEAAGEEAGATEPAAGEQAEDGAEGRTGAENIPGTGPAKAADDVEAAAGNTPAGD